MSPEDILSQPLNAEIQYFPENNEWVVDKFDNFVMKCGAKD